MVCGAQEYHGRRLATGASLNSRGLFTGRADLGQNRSDEASSGAEESSRNTETVWVAVTEDAFALYMSPILSAREFRILPRADCPPGVIVAPLRWLALEVSRSFCEVGLGSNWERPAPPPHGRSTTNWGNVYEQVAQPVTAPRQTPEWPPRDLQADLLEGAVPNHHGAVSGFAGTVN
jgi:hypothetical protein